MILSTHGFIASSIGQIDADAQAFFDRVTTAGGSLSATEKTAINTLVLQMKTDGIWTKMKAIYPMVGASSAACAQNLKSSSFTGTFTSGWTFASTGAKPNGASAYMDTGLSPNSHLTLNNTSIGIYNQVPTIAPKPDVPIGLRLSTSSSPAFWIRFYTNAYQSTSYGEDNTFISRGWTPANDWNQIKGMWFNSRISSTIHKIYKNGISIAQDTDLNSQDFSLLTHNITVSANNMENNTRVNFDSTEKSFAFIGDGLTDTEASNFYTAVQAFQTTLSRNV